MSHFTREQRDAWRQNTAESPFNKWLDSQVKDVDGALQLERLYEVALRFGVDGRTRYGHLNPGQQRMNIGNALRNLVPKSEYTELVNSTSSIIDRPSTVSKMAPASPERPSTITNASAGELLRMHGQIMDELRHRKIVRTSNGPGGDYAELLFSRAFRWTLAGNSASGHDAIDESGTRYQIKSRRLARPDSSRQLSALRRLPEAHFDWLAAVLFRSDYSVFKAVLVPYSEVVPRSRYSDHTKSWIFLLDDRVWHLAGVKDVTSEIAAAAVLL